LPLQNFGRRKIGRRDQRCAISAIARVASRRRAARALVNREIFHLIAVNREQIFRDSRESDERCEYSRANALLRSRRLRSARRLSATLLPLWENPRTSEVETLETPETLPLRRSCIKPDLILRLILQKHPRDAFRRSIARSGELKIRSRGRVS